MGKLISRLITLVCAASISVTPAVAQQQQKFTADQGKSGTAPWPVTWTDQSVQADLRVGGNAVTAGNPVPVTVGNFPATQPVSNAGTFAVQNNAPTPAGTNAIGTVGVTSLPPLPAGANSIGTVILGPGSASIGTIGNAFALDATITARLGTLGQKAMAASAPVTIASDQSPVPVSNGGTFAVQNNAATPAGTNTIGSIANVSGTVSLPTGAATAANQASEITQLTALNQRAQIFSPLLSNTALAAGGSAATPERLTGATTTGTLGPMTKYNVFVRTGDQGGTLNILARPVSNGATFTVFTYTYAANTSAIVTVPVMFGVYLTQFIQGATATSASGVSLADSLTTN